MSDALMLLRVQLEWGADEALAPAPIDRLAQRRTSFEPLDIPALASPVAGVAARASSIAAGCADLETLRASMEAFDGCPLRETAGHLAFADGFSGARLMMVIEAPGADDDAAGIPLSGKPGSLFDAMIGSVGESRRSVRIGCLVPWRPPGGRPPSTMEIAACRPFLLAHLRLMPAVTHLVLFGATVARAVGGIDGPLRQLRGSWHDLSVEGRHLRALVMAPLHAIESEPRQKAAAWIDLLNLRGQLDDASSR